MKRRTKIILTAVTTLLVGIGIIEWRWHPIVYRYLTHCLNISTIGLPRCDRVEIYHLDGKTDSDATAGFPIRPYEKFSRILNRRILAGNDAEVFAALWRSQNFGVGYQALCHEPGYGFKFYDGSSLKFETSVCFHCSNFYITALGKSGWWGFDTGSQSAASLLKQLQEFFPGSKPESKVDAPN